MQIARPPDGFKIIWTPTIDKMLEAERSARPGFDRFWGDLVEHLKVVAHKAGDPEPRLGNGCRLFATGPDPISGQPRIVVGYPALGDTVSIRLLQVS